MTDTSTPGVSDLPMENLVECPDAKTLDPTKNSAHEREDPKPTLESSTTQILQETQNQLKGPESARTTSIPNLNALHSGQLASQMTIEQQLQKSKRDLESMVLKYAKSERENLQNKNKVDELDKKLKRAIKDNDQLANRIKLLTNDKSRLTDTLNAKVAQLTVLAQKNSFLNDSQGVKLKEYDEKIKTLEATNEDLLKQIESYKTNEGELLDFSERLSMKHMILQSELDEALKRVPDYKELYEQTLEEKDELVRKVDELSRQIKLLNEILEKERECSKSLRNEKEENEVKYRYSLDELHNEIKVMRRKHQIATKELTKEIKLLHEQLGKVTPPT